MSTRFSILTPVYKPAPEHLAQTIQSVRKQTFTDWEWILVDDASGVPEVLQVLRQAAAADKRIKVIERQTNGHIVAASNDALKQASGAWIVLLDHDDLLLPQALEALHQAAQENPDAGYIYTDEDKIDDAGNLSGAFRKPDWSPERLRHQMYLGHLSALRADLVKRVGGFHAGFDGSQDHDLALRVTELCQQVVHVPKILYHWRIVPGSTAGDANAKDYATVAGLKAVAAHLQRQGLADTMQVCSHPRIAHTYDLQRQLDPNTFISVVIPTCGTPGIVWGRKRTFILEAVRSLLSHTTHTALEIVVVYDANTPQPVMEALRQLCGEKLTEVIYEKPFNFSDKCNQGFLAASGDVIVFLNDDMEIISPQFLEQLCAPLVETSVGATGAHLLYSDTSMQHAGLVFHREQMQHAYQDALADDPGYFAELCVDHEVSGLTGAALAVKQEDFAQVGGFSDLLPNNFNDVDLCLKLRAQGKRLLWLHDARAFHFESKSRVNTVQGWEYNIILQRWDLKNTDPYMPHEAAIMYQRLQNVLDAQKQLKQNT